MNAEPFRIVLASMSDRQSLTAEIYLGCEHVAEVSQERPGEFVVEIFSRQKPQVWSFDLFSLQKVLATAHHYLRERGAEED